MLHDADNETTQGLGAVELDGSHPPNGYYLLQIDGPPLGWIRSDPDPSMEYLSVNELVSQNNLRLAEFHAKTVAHGGEITTIGARSVQDCLKDARHAFYVAQAVRMCEMAASPHSENTTISFAELRKIQGVKNRRAFSTSGHVIDIEVHLADEALQRDAVEWWRSNNKPLPVPAPPEGTLALPGEFTKFPLFPSRDPGTSPAQYSTLDAPSYTSPVKTTGPRHKKNKTSMHCSGPATQEDLATLAYPPFSTLTPQQRATRDALKMLDNTGVGKGTKKSGGSNGEAVKDGSRPDDGEHRTLRCRLASTSKRSPDARKTGMFGGDSASDTHFDNGGPQTPGRVVHAKEPGVLVGDAAMGMPIFHRDGRQTSVRVVDSQEARMFGGGSHKQMSVFDDVDSQISKHIVGAMAMHTSDVAAPQTPSPKTKKTPTTKYTSSDQFNLAVANAHLQKNAPKFRTWADLKDNIPGGIQIPQLEQRVGMSPRQKEWIETHRATSPKKPYVPFSEREECPFEEGKIPNHVRLARARDGGFSPKKLDTELMPNLFTPKKDRTYPDWIKNSTEQQSMLGMPGGPSSVTKNISQDIIADCFSPDVDQDQFSMSPPKFFTHQRNYGISKSSPPARSPQRKNSVSVSSDQKANHTKKGAIDHAHSTGLDKSFDSKSKLSVFDNADDNCSSYSSFKYDKEQEDALMEGGFILSPPPVPEKSVLSTFQPDESARAPPKLRRIESSRNISPERKPANKSRSPPTLRRTESSLDQRKSVGAIGRQLGRGIESTRDLPPTKNLPPKKKLSPLKSSSSDTIRRQEGNGLTKSFTSYDLAMLAAEPSVMPRSETVPDNLQEASANVFDDVPDMPDAPALPIVSAAVLPLVEKMSPIKEVTKSTELGYRDTLQFKDKAELSKAPEPTPQPESPSKMKKAVNSMAMFRSSFWNKDEAVSKRAVVATASNSEDNTATAEQKVFEEKKPFIKTKWFNLKSMIGKKTKPTQSRFQVSCDTTFQLRLYSDLELLLITVANRYLNDEYDAGRISRSQASKCVHKWVGMGRAQFTEWNAGQLHQSQYIWEFRDQLIFFGTYNKIQRDATLSTWSINAKEMSVRSGCNGDSQIQKHFMDSWKVLELLGGSLDEFLQMSRLHVSFHDMVATKKADNDAKGIKHEWNPAPIPKTPAPGALVRTPMLK